MAQVSLAPAAIYRELFSYYLSLTGHSIALIAREVLARRVQGHSEGQRTLCQLEREWESLNPSLTSQIIMQLVCLFMEWKYQYSQANAIEGSEQFLLGATFCWSLLLSKLPRRERWIIIMSFLLLLRLLQFTSLHFCSNLLIATHTLLRERKTLLPRYFVICLSVRVRQCQLFVQLPFSECYSHF